jgi:hypothetical protein
MTSCYAYQAGQTTNIDDLNANQAISLIADDIEYKRVIIKEVSDSTISIRKNSDLTVINKTEIEEILEVGEPISYYKYWNPKTTSTDDLHTKQEVSLIADGKEFKRVVVQEVSDSTIAIRKDSDLAIINKTDIEEILEICEPSTGYVYKINQTTGIDDLRVNQGVTLIAKGKEYTRVEIQEVSNYTITVEQDSRLTVINKNEIEEILEIGEISNERTILTTMGGVLVGLVIYWIIQFDGYSFSTGH